LDRFPSPLVSVRDPGPEVRREVGNVRVLVVPDERGDESNPRQTVQNREESLQLAFVRGAERGVEAQVIADPQPGPVPDDPAVPLELVEGGRDVLLEDPRADRDHLARDPEDPDHVVFAGQLQPEAEHRAGVQGQPLPLFGVAHAAVDRRVVAAVLGHGVIRRALQLVRR
jgi:hypothetical protein